MLMETDMLTTTLRCQLIDIILSLTCAISNISNRQQSKQCLDRLWTGEALQKSHVKYMHVPYTKDYIKIINISFRAGQTSVLASDIIWRQTRQCHSFVAGWP